MNGGTLRLAKIMALNKKLYTEQAHLDIHQSTTQPMQGICDSH